MSSNKEIIALSDFEHMLLRPEVWCGSTNISEERVAIIRDGKIISDYKDVSVAFYKLMDEALSNAFDESKRMKGEMKKIEINFDSKTNEVTVMDTGGGFINASKINDKTGKSNVETAFSVLRAGSNFFNDDTKESLIGRNGAGISICSMLSDHFSVRTVNNMESYSQTWTKFVPTKPVIESRKPDEQTGTTVSFIPRRDTFKHCKWDKEYIHSIMIFKQFLKKLDPLISNLEFTCTFDGEKLDLDVDFIPDKYYKIDTKIGTLIVWESFSQSTTVTFVNGAMCGGIHHRIVVDWLNELFETPSAYRFYECFIILNLPPKMVNFGDQNKTKFDTSRKDISPLLEKYFLGQLRKQLKNSEVYGIIMKKIAESDREGDVRNLRNKKRTQKNKISDKYFPASTKPKNLIIVEGQSAAGGTCQKRNSHIDAVYALKGKIKNARKLSDLTSNSEIVDLMNILNLDPENDRACKFEKIIIATDFDNDGIGHIASLLVNLFYKWFPNVIRQGKLYILQTPLMTAEEGKKIKHFYNTRDIDKLTKLGKKFTNIRYLKGLGSLSISDWEYVFNDMHLLHIMEDSKSEKMLEMAFGTNASLRKKWLQG